MEDVQRFVSMPDYLVALMERDDITEDQIKNRVKRLSSRERGRAVSYLLYTKAELDTPQKELWFGVLARAVIDLGNPYYERKWGEYEAVAYFRHGDFKVHAEIVGLSPEYVIGILLEYNLFNVEPVIEEVA